MDSLLIKHYLATTPSTDNPLYKLLESLDHEELLALYRMLNQIIIERESNNEARG